MGITRFPELVPGGSCRTQKLLFLILGITLILAVLILPNGIAALPKRIRDSRWTKELQRRLGTLVDFSL